MALLHLDHVRVRSADVTHKYRVTSLPVCTECVGFACGSFLWGLQNSWPLCGYKKSLLPLKREDLPLCIYSLVLHLDIAAFLLQCCGSFGMEHVNLCTVKKARIKNAFLTFGSYQDSNISVICSLWPYVLLSACRVPQGCFFCWCERNDGVIFIFFFFYCAAYQQPWRGLSAKCSNAGCSYKRGAKHHRIMDHPENSFQLRNG